MDPDSLTPCEQTPDFDDLLSHFLVNSDEILPVLEEVISHISDVLEVVKQWF